MNFWGGLLIADLVCALISPDQVWSGPFLTYVFWCHHCLIFMKHPNLLHERCLMWGLAELRVEKGFRALFVVSCPILSLYLPPRFLPPLLPLRLHTFNMNRHAKIYRPTTMMPCPMFWISWPCRPGPWLSISSSFICFSSWLFWVLILLLDRAFFLCRVHQYWYPEWCSHPECIGCHPRPPHIFCNFGLDTAGFKACGQPGYNFTQVVVQRISWGVSGSFGILSVSLLASAGSFFYTYCAAHHAIAHAPYAVVWFHGHWSSSSQAFQGNHCLFGAFFA